MKKKIWVLVIVIGIIIMLRTIFDSNKNLIYIVAGINIVAIVFVIYTIIEKIVYNVIKRIQESGIPEQIMSREIAGAQYRIWFWSVVISAGLIVLYLTYWCSNLGNDIISILALGISVLDDEIVQMIADNYKM